MILVVHPGPAHLELGAVKAFGSGESERCQDGVSTEPSWSSIQTGDKQHVNGAPSFPAPRHLGVVRAVSTAGPLNADLMVVFEMAGCNCQQRIKTKCYSCPSLLGTGVRMVVVTKEPPQRGQLSSSPHHRGIPARVEVLKKGALAASRGLFDCQSIKVFSENSVQTAPDRSHRGALCRLLWPPAPGLRGAGRSRKLLIPAGPVSGWPVQTLLGRNLPVTPPGHGRAAHALPLCKGIFKGKEGRKEGKALAKMEQSVL